jgi:hypothetical protein
MEEDLSPTTRDSRLSYHANLALLPTKVPRSGSDSGLTQDDLDQSMKKSVEAKSECAIPAEFIFLPSPHLALEGFGWVPKSWMSGGLPSGWVSPESVEERQEGNEYG